MKALVSAYACNPRKGSEEGVGWNWVRCIAAFADPTVLVAEYHQSDIEDYLQQHPGELDHVRFVFVPHRPWHYRPTSLWKKVEGSLLKPAMNLAYMLWLRDAGKLARQLHRQEPFSLAHQLTYVGFRFPGHLWKLGVPFVWGPIGGLENTPWRFLPVLGVGGAVYYTGRNLINGVQRLFLRSARKAFRQADRVIAATSGIQREIRCWYGVGSRVICEVGPPEGITRKTQPREAHEPLRLIWSGEHLPGKALPLLLQALSHIENGYAWHLDILGHGPLTDAWRRQAVELGLDDRCTWHGLLPRDEALEAMSRGHLLVITSLKDLTSTVLLEALALGLPVVCPDHCGFSDVVNEECGIKLPVRNPAQLVADMAQAIEALCRDESRRQALAEGAVRRAGEYSWGRKAVEIEEVYRIAMTGAGANKS